MDMKFLMKQAQVMQKKMEEMKIELAQKEVRVSSGGGMIEIVVNGQQEIKEIKIEPDVIAVSYTHLTLPTILRV